MMDDELFFFLAVFSSAHNVEYKRNLFNLQDFARTKKKWDNLLIACCLFVFSDSQYIDVRKLNEAALYGSKGAGINIDDGPANDAKTQRVLITHYIRR